MKRIIALTIIFTLAFSVNTFAIPQYSAETQRLMEEAGIGEDNSVEEIMRRQEEYRRNKASNSTPNTVTGQNGTNRTLKSINDELKIVGGSQSVKVTNTEDELHIYNNNYNAPSASVYSNDELRINGVKAEPNDGYSKDNFDELHIDPVYQQNLWKPANEVKRLGIDEFRLPNDPY